MFNRALLLQGVAKKTSRFHMQVGYWLDVHNELDCRGFSTGYHSAGTLEPAVFEGSNILVFRLYASDAGISTVPPPKLDPLCYISFDAPLPSPHLRVTVNGQEYMFYAYGSDGLQYTPTGVDTIYVREGEELEIQLELIYYDQGDQSGGTTN